MTSKSTNFYSQSADEALVSMAQAGVLKAETVLLERYRSFVKSIASKFFSDSMESDDIVQEGLLGLISAIYSFSEERKVSFRTYSAVCIQNSIRTALKAELRLKNLPLNSYVPLDDVDIVSGFSPEEMIISDENTLRIRNIINSSLSDLEKKVLYAHISGERYKAIAEKLMISEKSVDNALQRIRIKISRLLRDDES